MSPLARKLSLKAHGQTLLLHKQAQEKIAHVLLVFGPESEQAFIEAHSHRFRPRRLAAAGAGSPPLKLIRL